MSYTTYFYDESHILQGYINLYISLECANSVKHILHNNTLTIPGLYRLYNSTSNSISYTLYNNLFSLGDISISQYINPTEISIHNSSTETCQNLFKIKKKNDNFIQYLNVIQGEANCDISINIDNSNQIRCLCNSSISPVLLYTDPLYDHSNLNLSKTCSTICDNASIASPKLAINGCKNTILTTDSKQSDSCIFSVRDNSYQIKSGYIYSKSRDYWLDLCNTTAYSLSEASNYCINDPKCVGIFTTPLLDTSWVLSYTSTLTKYDDASYIPIRNIKHIISPMTYKSNTYEAGTSPTGNTKKDSYKNIYTGKKIPSYFKYISQYSTHSDISNPISIFKNNIIIKPSTGTANTQNYFIFFGMSQPPFINKLNSSYNWNTIYIQPLISDKWGDTKMGWTYNGTSIKLNNAIDDEVCSYSLTWKVLEWLKNIFTYKNGIPQINKLVVGGHSNGAAFTSRIFEDHARWHYNKDGSGAYISWLRYVDPDNIAGVFITGGSHHCYANPSGATQFNHPDSYYIFGDKTCKHCLPISTDTSMRNSQYENTCYKTGSPTSTGIPWNKSCYYCCPEYTQKTYMENSTLPYPPILTYQYTTISGQCNGNSKSICEGYTYTFNNGNGPWHAGRSGKDLSCGSSHDVSAQYSPSPYCLFDIYADTCAGNKLYSVAKQNKQTNFNKLSKSIGITNYIGIGASHISYPPTTTDTSRNYSIYKWLFDISFIDNLQCIMCEPTGGCPSNMFCAKPNSLDEHNCCHKK